MTMKVANSYNQEGGKGRWWSTWGLWSRGLQKAIAQEIQDLNHQDHDHDNQEGH
jgi:hypothetical protein